MPALRDAPTIPAGIHAGASTSLDVAATRARVVLATSDPVFAVLCKRAVDEATNPMFLVTVSPPELLETARRVAHDVLVLDADGQDVAALKTLATKVSLVSDAPMVLLSAYLAPGSPGLGALLQSIPATFVQKPQGPSSISVADEDGPLFISALQASFAGYEDRDLTVDDVDAGWDAQDELTAEEAGAVDD